MPADVDASGHESNAPSNPGPLRNSLRAWIEPDPNAPVGCGRIMVSTPTAANPIANASAIALLNRAVGILPPDSPRVASNFSIRAQAVANDNAIWIGEDRDGSNSGVFGSDADLIALGDGAAVVAWIGDDRTVRARFVPGADEETAWGSAARLNALLANLGAAGPVASPGQERLKLSPFGANGFAVFWLSELGNLAALAGKVFLAQPLVAGAHEDALVEKDWGVSDFPPLKVPGAAYAIAVREVAPDKLHVAVVASPYAHAGEGITDEAALVDVAISNGAGGIEVATLVSNEPYAGEEPSENGVAAEGYSDMGAASVFTDGSRGDDGLRGEDVVQPAGGASMGNGDERAGSSKTSADLSHATGSIGPAVIVSGSGVAFALDVTLNPDGETSTLQFVIVGDDHRALPVVVTDKVVTTAATNPNLDLAIGVAGTANGIGISWLEAFGAGEVALKVQSYDGHGTPETAAPVTVVITSQSVVSISDLGIAYVGQAGTGPTYDGSPPDFAVVWVENADAAGYGSIKAQLFAVHELGGQATGMSEEGSGSAHRLLVAVGADGQIGGDSDGAFSPAVAGIEGSGALGRDPAVTQAGDHALAVTWIHEASQGSGVEVLSGIVVDTADGAVLAALDLADLMPRGLIAGTDAQTLTTDSGDVIFAWIEADAAGGVTAAAAVFAHAGPHTWVKPAATTVLTHFDSVPNGLTMALAGPNDAHLTLSWANGGDSVTSQSFELEALSHGEEAPARARAHDPGGVSSGEGAFDFVDVISTSGADALADAGDAILFLPGYGNDIPSHADDQTSIVDSVPLATTVAEAFDGVQFVDMLRDSAFMDVITFDEQYSAMIRDFGTIGV